VVTRILYVVELDKSGDGDTENVLLPRIFVLEAIGDEDIFAQVLKLLEEI
jgi:hypothetical protein